MSGDGTELDLSKQTPSAPAAPAVTTPDSAPAPAEESTIELTLRDRREGDAFVAYFDDTKIRVGTSPTTVPAEHADEIISRASDVGLRIEKGDN